MAIQTAPIRDTRSYIDNRRFADEKNEVQKAMAAKHAHLMCRNLTARNVLDADYVQDTKQATDGIMVLPTVRLSFRARDLSRYSGRLRSDCMREFTIRVKGSGRETELQKILRNDRGEIPDYGVYTCFDGDSFLCSHIYRVDVLRSALIRDDDIKEKASRTNWKSGDGFKTAFIALRYDDFDNFVVARSSVDPRVAHPMQGVLI